MFVAVQTPNPHYPQTRSSAVNLLKLRKSHNRSDRDKNQRHGLETLARSLYGDTWEDWEGTHNKMYSTYSVAMLVEDKISIEDIGLVTVSLLLGWWAEP